jgi:hypothetical protein
VFGCADDDDFGQAGTLYCDVMSATDRELSVANIVGHASDGVTETIQQCVIAYWASVDADLGTRVATGLGMVTATGRRGTPRGWWQPGRIAPDGAIDIGQALICASVRLRESRAVPSRTARMRLSTGMVGCDRRLPASMRARCDVPACSATSRPRAGACGRRRGRRPGSTRSRRTTYAMHSPACRSGPACRFPSSRSSWGTRRR